MADDFEARTGEMHNLSDPAFRDPIRDPVVDPLSRPLAQPFEGPAMKTPERRRGSTWLPLILGALVALGLIFWFSHDETFFKTAQNTGTTTTQTVNPAPAPPAAQPPAVQPAAPNP